MPAASHEPVGIDLLNEIEAISLSKNHMKVVDELENGNGNFKNFQSLVYLEYNVRVLAEDYMDKFRKNLICRNEQIKSIAKRFAFKTSNHEVIKEAKNQPQKLRNDRILEMLIKIAKDCVESAYILATHRKELRQQANFEQLLEGQAIMTQKLNVLVEKIHLHPVGTAHAEAPNVRPNAAPIQNVPQQLSPQISHATAIATVAPPNQNQPSWLIHEDDCRILYNSNLTADSFTRTYLIKLLTICELILPSKDIPREKKNEFLLVAPYFFVNDQETDWESKFEKTLKNLRFQKRQAVFKKVNDKIGYGITELGVEFYYPRPLSKQTQFFSRKECNVGSLLNTKLCGSFKIPEKCGSFAYLLFIEKTGRLSNFNKLLPNGELLKVC